MCRPLMPNTLVQIADIAKKQQDAATALWNAKYRLEDHAGSLKSRKLFRFFISVLSFLSSKISSFSPSIILEEIKELCAAL